MGNKPFLQILPRKTRKKYQHNNRIATHYTTYYGSLLEITKIIIIIISDQVQREKTPQMTLTTKTTTTTIFFGLNVQKIRSVIKIIKTSSLFLLSSYSKNK